MNQCIYTNLFIIITKHFFKVYMLYFGGFSGYLLSLLSNMLEKPFINWHLLQLVNTTCILKGQCFQYFNLILYIWKEKSTIPHNLNDFPIHFFLKNVILYAITQMCNCLLFNLITLAIMTCLTLHIMLPITAGKDTQNSYIYIWDNYMYYFLGIFYLAAGKLF